LSKLALFVKSSLELHCLNNAPVLDKMKKIHENIADIKQMPKRMTVVNFKNMYNYRDKISCKTQTTTRQ